MYEANPQLHIKKLREFLHRAKRYYTGEDQELLVRGTEAKIKEIQHKIDQEALYEKRD